ncbi:MAG: class I SAM-dependent methyltransferase [Solirubrobacterales bacterium]
MRRCAQCGLQFDELDGVPVLVAGVTAADVDQRAAGGELPGHDCRALGIAEVDEAFRRGDEVLELGAGRESARAANLTRTDAFVYDAASLDAVADAHALPFADGSFDFVFSLAVFEHLHSPWVAAQEIARVLRPGGRVYVLCAFYQQLHGYPDHYFNATESGLRRLFADGFEIERCGPSAFCGPRESAVPLFRMEEMAEAARPA